MSILRSFMLGKMQMHQCFILPLIHMAVYIVPSGWRSSITTLLCQCRWISVCVLFYYCSILFQYNWLSGFLWLLFQAEDACLQAACLFAFSWKSSQPLPQPLFPLFLLLLLFNSTLEGTADEMPLNLNCQQ